MIGGGSLMHDQLPIPKAQLLDRLRALPKENEWFEFKEGKDAPQEIGEYLSALANSARLKGRSAGYLVYGIADGSHEIKGTTFRPTTKKGKGNEDLIPWLTRGLRPPVRLEVDEGLYQGKPVVIFEVGATANQPVTFYGEAFIRVQSTKQPLSRHPELERALWNMGEDWTAQPCRGASLKHIDKQALAKARAEFKKKQPRQADEVDQWDDRKFLSKARAAIDGELTNAAILLLGNDEAEHLLAPTPAWMMWTLKGASGEDRDYEHFRTPLILNVDRLFARVRNLRIRYLPDNTLFPVEIDQYDPWVIREALHNAIAHQNYGLGGRIVVVEKEDELVFSNVGDFLPGDVESVVREDVPPRRYRNWGLCQIMVSFGMIDTQGGGIRRMFMEQKRRGFPMPEYDLSRPDEVRVRIPGRVIDTRYTKLLIENPELDLDTAMLLDRVQKDKPLERPQYDHLKRLKLVEGRWGAFHVTAEVAAAVGSKADYIRQRGLDTKHYEELLLEFLRKFREASRKEIDDLLMEKLPDVLTNKQKINKIHNLLTSMKRRGLIERTGGSTRAARWKLTRQH